MAGYQRMVSYLYEYNRGEKGENVGYAKLEIRDAVAKMIVSIRLRRDLAGICPVEFYYREGRQAYRAAVGEVKLTGGRTEERILLPGARVGETGLPVAQMNGILITIPDGVIGSAWDEQPVPVNTALIRETGELRAAEVSDISLTDSDPWEPEAEPGETAEELSSEENFSEEMDFTEESISEEQPIMKGPEKERDREPEELAAKEDVEEEIAEEPGWEQWEQEPELKQEEAGVRLESKAEEPEMEQPEPDFGGYAMEEDGFIPSPEYFFQNGNRMCPFEDGAVTNCVRIEPADLEYFPRETWILGSNSFLLHGYYSYGHLILAKMSGMGKESTILGVPGLYQSRERFLAKIFGFEYFKPVSRNGVEEGSFGYWYLFLPEIVD